MRRNRGFTLIELLVVIAILSILMALVVGLAGYADMKSRVSATESQVHTIGCKLDLEVKLEGRVPPALIDVEPKIGVPQWIQGGQFVDSWDRPLQYAPSGRTFRLWSMGADGISGNADDIGYGD